MGAPTLSQVPHLVKLDNHDSRFHKETVADILHRGNTNFPGAQPVSFARRHLKELREVDYYLAEKTDGIRLLLFCTQIHDANGQSREAQFLIDRKNDYYYVESGYLHIPRPNPPGAPPGYDLHSYHIGTLLDGELVIQTIEGRQHLVYLIFDCLALNGESVTERPYDQRIEKYKKGVMKAYGQFIKEWPDEKAAQPFELKSKSPGVAYAANQMFRDELPKLPHGNDGLIYTCKVTSYVSGTDQHILKWKPPHENTIDFKLQLGAFPIERDEEGEYEDYDQKPEVDLLVFQGGSSGAYQYFAKLHLTDAEWEAMKRMNQPFDHRIIECWREKDTGHWRPKIDSDGTPRFRDDKDHANHVSVVESVLESIEDAVTQQDLEAAYDRIRTAWKEREKHAQMKQRQEDHKRQQEAARQREAPPQAQVRLGQTA